MKYTFICFFLLLAPMTQAQEPTQNSENEFIYRVALGRADDVALLIKEGADVNQHNRAGWPAINVAAARNDSEALPILRLLTDAGADVNDCKPGIECPLIASVKAGNDAAVHFLLEKGADVTVTDASGRTGLQLAKEQGDAALAARLEDATLKHQQEVERKRTPEYINGLVFQYAFSNCASQYAANFIESGQGTAEENARFAEYRKHYDTLIRSQSNELQRIIRIPAEKLLNAASKSKEDIVSQLNTYVSNRERQMDGVGTDDDMTRRCNGIASQWNVQNASKK